MVKGFRALTRPPSLQEQYRETPFFVENYYLEQFTTGKPRAPLAHFHEVGWRRNLNPSPFFDVAFYLEDNEDVRRAGINPLVHYLDFGWKEGRMPHPNFDARGFLWAHPDIVPVDVDIDDPTLLIARLTGDEPAQDDVDRALQELLDDSTGERPTED